ncbi:MAG: response regulator [Leptonema sp. (in: Bacteria)]|nr:response regulator [Leptonema sp. (in: bacteria)]
MKIKPILISVILLLVGCQPSQSLQIEILADDENILTLTDLVQNKKEFENRWHKVKLLSRGSFKGQLFIRYTVPSNLSGRYWLTIRNPALEHVDFLPIKHGKPTDIIYDGTDSSSLLRFPSIDVDTNSVQQVYIRVKTRSSYRIPLSLMSDDDRLSQVRIYAVLPATVIGAAIAIIIFYLFLWSRTRDLNSLHLISYIIPIVLYRLLYHGYFVEYFKPNHGGLPYTIIGILFYGATLSLLWWVYREFRPIAFPKSKIGFYATLFFISFYSVLIVLVFFNAYLASKISYLFILPYAGYLSFITIFGLKSKSSSVKWFGWSLLTYPISIILHVAFTKGLSQLNSFADFAIDGSLLIQILMMAYSISDRIHSEIENSAQKLESQVRERTLKLREEVKARAIAQETAEQASKAKTQFLANISHEIRTPMNVILGANELLGENQDLNDDQKQLLLVMKKAGNNLLTIINDLLHTSKLELSQVQLDAQEFATHDWLQNLFTPFELRMQASSVDLRLEVKNLPNYLVGDQARLSQILNNLLSNAIKFTKKGSITVSVDSTKISDSIYQIEFQVIDTGIGIELADQPHLFEPFSISSARTAAEFGGTGLGLSISYSLAKLMGGSLSVESAVDQGSTFTLKLPMAISTEKSATNVKEDQTLPFIKATVLIAEDQPENQFLFERYLKDQVQTIIFANNGQEAIEIFKTSQIDLILMDIRMPVIDGYQALSEIHQLEKSEKLTSIPILALTAHALDSERERLKDAGFTDILTKPIRKIDLILAIAKHLDHKV